MNGLCVVKVNLPKPAVASTAPENVMVGVASVVVGGGVSTTSSISGSSSKVTMLSCVFRSR